MNTQKTLLYVTSIGLLVTMILLGIALMLCNKMADKIIVLENQVQTLQMNPK